MCRRKQLCRELGVDSKNWSTQALLLPPAWFEEQLDLFRTAVEEAASGRLAAARDILGGIRSDELREWFVEHGQVAGNFRYRHFGKLPAGQTGSQCDHRGALTRQLKLAVYARDGYRCRYCGIRLISENVLKAFGNAVGCCLTWNKTNAQTHGLLLAFGPVADHVVNWRQGGPTTLDNLVSACWSCNYGKSSYTLNQLGLDDPRDRPPATIDHWDGLQSYLPLLEQ